MSGFKPPPPSYGDIPLARDDVVRDRVRLHENSRERRRFSDLGDFYGIVQTTEHLENAFIRGAISSKHYTEACGVLLAQFKAAEQALLAEGHIESTEKFMEEYMMECPKARHRLIIEGIPEQIRKSDDDRDVAAAQAASDFITAKDALSMNMNDVDELQPLLRNLMDSLVKLSLPKECQAVLLVRKWLGTLNKMRAAEAISDEQNREMIFDLDKGYFKFIEALKK
jgi:ESCRT-I complex subunit VPS28